MQRYAKNALDYEVYCACCGFKVHSDEYYINQLSTTERVDVHILCRNGAGGRWSWALFDNSICFSSIKSMSAIYLGILEVAGTQIINVFHTY